TEEISPRVHEPARQNSGIRSTSLPATDGNLGDRTRLLARSRASNSEGSVRVSRDASREVFLATRGDGQEVWRAPLKESAGAESRASASKPSRDGTGEAPCWQANSLPAC